MRKAGMHRTREDAVRIRRIDREIHEIVSRGRVEDLLPRFRGIVASKQGAAAEDVEAAIVTACDGDPATDHERLWPVRLPRIRQDDGEKQLEQHGYRFLRNRLDRCWPSVTADE